MSKLLWYKIFRVENLSTSGGRGRKKNYLHSQFLIILKNRERINWQEKQFLLQVPTVELERL
jgi:hypothetical protein